MNKLRLKCKCCNNYHAYVLEKKVPNGFSGWAYSESVEWSDFEKEVPPLSEKHWPRSDRIPRIDEFRILKVNGPFNEKYENKFYIEFMPALAFFNGYDNVEQLHDSAIVQCRLKEVIAADAYSAWINKAILVNIRHFIQMQMEFAILYGCITGIFVKMQPILEMLFSKSEIH